jgi:CheY-like chemotaxis protein
MLQPQVLNLNDVVSATQKLLARAIGEHIELVVRLAPDVEHVRVDPNQLDQILINLAVNARDAMPTGGTLTIETRNVAFNESYEAAHLDAKSGHCVMLAISDTGTGMTPEVKARIFEPFFTTKPKGEGTGLGLAMVLGIVEQSGGWIHVYSEAGLGTTVKIYLPAVAEAVPASRPIPPKRNYSGTETVLIVEDDEDVREIAMTSLKVHGYRVICASGGAEAIAAAHEHERIDLLLTDVVMPKMNGSELARELRAQFPDLKVLIMSGYTEDTVLRQGLLAASVSFIQKPYTPVSLARKVREVLDMPEQAAELSAT